MGFRRHLSKNIAGAFAGSMDIDSIERVRVEKYVNRSDNNSIVGIPFGVRENAECNLLQTRERSRWEQEPVAMQQIPSIVRRIFETSSHRGLPVLQPELPIYRISETRRHVPFGCTEVYYSR